LIAKSIRNQESHHRDIAARDYEFSYG
jgi:hypothetical protein